MPSRLLVVAPNWLGDVVMATSLLTWLDAVRRREGGPRFRIVVAIRAAWAPLLAGDPRVDELLIQERPGAHEGLRGLARLAGQWRGAGCEAVILGPPSFRVALAATLAGIPRRVGQAADGRRWLLTDPVPRPSRGSRHYRAELLELGLALGRAAGWDATELPAVWPPPPAALCVPSGPVPRQDSATRPLWAYGPGTTYGPAKTWPPRAAAGFVRAAVVRHGARVLLLGDGAATPLVDELRAATTDLRWARGEAAAAPVSEADVVDLTGATDLPGVVAWLRRCALYVGNDSGLMHVAAAVGVPVVGLFGSSDPDWTSPSGPRVAVLAAEGFPCRPCYRRTCNQPVFCLDTIDGERVLKTALELLDTQPGGHGGGPEVRR